ncbi:MAG TPA: N-acetylmuramoyl-L-alanine amidase-like domain-containing protein [Pseudolabrys sp.]|nr:N-acetylmuramoyl-L-alanine amidase-like domain-containing protein [Pseudolabrys sp.]
MTAGAPKSRANEARIAKLIEDSRSHGGISQRIDFISAHLLGTHYLGYTLIGSPKKPEVFVVRDDGFDCVTYCETVLAAARARNIGEFETALRDIRYHNGVVAWRERNHYFFEWGQHNVENKVLKPVPVDGAVDIVKAVDSQAGLEPRRFTMRVIPRPVFQANKHSVQRGDIVGFVSHRTDLDYFHAGFIALKPDGAVLLRSAAESHGRVVDESMEAFLARYSVRYVSVWRPQEPAVA